MSKIQVAVLVGSIRKDSLNLRLAKAIEKQLSNEMSFKFIKIDDLPLYTQDFDSNYPAVCQRLKDEIQSAQAVLVVTPEYNRSIPGVLKNALDIASRPWGTNSFAGKPGAVIGTSPGAAGTSMAQQHLRNVLSYLDVTTMSQPEAYLHYRGDMIAEDGTISEPKTTELLQGFSTSFSAWVKRLSSK